MIQDASSIAGSSLGAEVCIVGAGPAGLVVAAELVAAGVEVVVLEAGGSAYDRHDRSNLFKVLLDHARGAQSLTRGVTRGEPYYPLRMSRARGLGGSTNALLSHGLRARPLDPIDLGPRFGSQWPIPHQELARHLGAAEVYAGLRSAGEDPIEWEPVTFSSAASPASIVAAPFRHGARDRVPRLADEVAATGKARVLINAVATGFRTTASGSIQAVDVAAPGGTTFTVTAEAYVLAVGGIDNARLLLSSRPVLYAMEAAADQVGRKFMEHLHYVAGYLVPSSEDAFAEVQARLGAAMETWLTADDEVVRTEDLLRVGLAAVPVHAASLSAGVPAFGELARMTPYGPFGARARIRQATTAAKGSSQVVRAMAARVRAEGRTVFALPLMSEQQPDRDSRISLTNRRDRTGLPLPVLDWRVGKRDFADARRTLELLAVELDRLGLGRIESLWDRGAERPHVVTGGWHHMGTTAMSSTAETGVVDEDCRVHGLENLYVAGSSVFPTSGYANPTLTLMALAVRLGRHLAGAMTAP
jgi:choline dehydrogenase-like flavoprotein